MRVKLWGVRGSIPVPGSAAAGYGGNTSCVEVTTADGTELILDAGSGIRELGAAIAGRCRHVHVLLTHLHLDHIQGLMFFAPLFDPAVEVTVWGPPAAGRALRERVARYISSPLCPVEIRELPARVIFEDAPTSPWRLGGVDVRASLVAHRGPTLGYRLEAGAGSLCYLPDHEPGLGQDLDKARPAWISGHALAFAHRAEPAWTLLFHHDPGHDDVHLDAIGEEARSLATLRGQEGAVEMAREGRLIELAI